MTTSEQPFDGYKISYPEEAYTLFEKKKTRLKPAGYVLVVLLALLLIAGLFDALSKVELKLDQKPQGQKVPLQGTIIEIKGNGVGATEYEILRERRTE